MSIRAFTVEFLDSFLVSFYYHFTAKQRKWTKSGFENEPKMAPKCLPWTNLIIVGFALWSSSRSYHWTGHNVHSSPLCPIFILVVFHIILVIGWTLEGQTIHCRPMVVLWGVPKPVLVVVHLHKKAMRPPNKIGFITSTLCWWVRDCYLEISHILP